MLIDMVRHILVEAEVLGVPRVGEASKGRMDSRHHGRYLVPSEEVPHERPVDLASVLSLIEGFHMRPYARVTPQGM